MAFKRILLRRDTSSNWTSGNAVLAAGEVGYETNTGKFKIGNGSTAWTSLAYSIVSNISAAVLNDLGDVTITSAANGDFLRWNGTAWINDAVNLSTDTIGSYVESLVAGTGVTLTNNSGEGATPTIAVNTSVIQARVANITDTEIGYLDGVTSAIQTQIDAKAPLASPTFTGTVTLPDNTVALGTKTTGDYVATITGGTGVSSTAATTGEGTTHTLSIGQSVATNANPTFAGATLDAVQVGVTAANEIDTTSGGLTIDSAGGTVTVDDNLTVTGNLTVSGTTTSINTETLTVDDNIIVLNNNVTAAPTENAGIEVERGSSTNVFLRWNETDDAWELTNDGSTYSPIATIAVVAATLALENLTDANIVTPAAGQFLKYNGSEWVNDAIDLGTDTTGNYMSNVSAGTGISVTHTPGEGSTATVAVDTAVIQARVANVTDTEIGYLDGVTSAIQTQMNLKAPLASPTFTGTPTLPTGTIATTQTANDSTTAVATTAFVTTADNLKANLASPTFTGTPTAPTAAVGTSTTQIATTEFVMANAEDDQFILAGQIF